MNSTRRALFVIAFIAHIAGLYAQPTTRSTSRPALPPPALSTAKVTATPHFYQKDARCGLAQVNDGYCVPAAVSDGLVYLGNHGFGKLLPANPADPELAQGEIVKQLASADYMDTGSIGTGTTVSEALTGIRRYVENHGYVCDRLEYAG